MARVDDLSSYRGRKGVPQDAPEAEEPRGEAAPGQPTEEGGVQADSEDKRKRVERRRARREQAGEDPGDAGKQAAETEDDIFGEMTLPAGKPAGAANKRKAGARPKTGAAKQSEAAPQTPDQGEKGNFVPFPGRTAPASPEKPRESSWARLSGKLRGLLPLLLVVGLPTLAASVYYLFIASDLYYTETRVSVRSPSNQSTPSLMSSAMGGIQLGSASIEADSIVEFTTSHDAVRQLMDQVDVRAVFSREEGDFLSRLSAEASFEDLVEHFQDRVEVVYNQTSGIITIGAKTYRPEDSQALLSALNDVSEELVNTFNRRAEGDALRLARSEVERAEARMAEVRGEILQFRLTNQELDPEQRSGGILEIISRLEGEYAQVASQLSEQSAYMDSGSMQITALRNKLQAIQDQIQAEEQRLTGGEEGDRRYANVLNDYEMLMLERELAHQEYTSAIASLEGARLEAQRQQVYLVPIVEPHEAETAQFPRRAENIGLVFLASLLIFLIGRLIVRGIQDHLMN